MTSKHLTTYDVTERLVVGPDRAPDVETDASTSTPSQQCHVFFFFFLSRHHPVSKFVYQYSYHSRYYQ
jgi:hypothetical protein